MIVITMSLIEYIFVLKGDTNGDGRITVVDFNNLSNHLNNSQLIHDPNITSTLRGNDNENN